MTATAKAGARVIRGSLRSSMRTGYLGPWIDREVVRQVGGRLLCRPTGESQFRVGRFGGMPPKDCIALTGMPVSASETTCAGFVREIP
jgi:hypothetical protein